MFKKTLAFTDVFDVERSEDFYFNISKSELTELELTTPGGYGYYIQRVVTAKTPKETFEALKAIVKLAYGVRHESGSFLKSEENWALFEGSGAYDVLMMSFFEGENSEDLASEFVNNAFPKELVAEAKRREAEEAAAKKQSHPAPPEAGRPATIPSPEVGPSGVSSASDAQPSASAIDRVQERLADPERLSSPPSTE